MPLLRIHVFATRRYTTRTLNARLIRAAFLLGPVVVVLSYFLFTRWLENGLLRAAG